MLIKRPDPILSSEITPRGVFEGRRGFLQKAAAGSIAAAALELALPGPLLAQNSAAPKLAAKPNSSYTVADRTTPYKDVTTYNNYYEFGTDKSDPAETAHTLKTRPWTIQVDGLVKSPMTFGIDDLLKLAPLEERVYRHRCVEGWSMVIPWIGFPLSALLARVAPTGDAKYVEFVTLADKSQMPGLNAGVLDWPYREGLRLDEANHPLTLLTFGLYGEVLPNQNGAPVRLVVPWKYGFKSAKSIVRISLTNRLPLTSWNRAAPSEYGFYSNVNPNVDHPRWSQATERRIGAGSVFTPKQKTLMFNGYESEVGQLYAGMDLRKFF